MPTRVTENMLYHRSQASLTKARDQLLSNQEAAVSQKRINRPSDDPVGAMRGVNLKAEIQRQERVGTNLELVNSLMRVTDTSLGELTDLIIRAKELAVQMSSSTNQNEDSRKATLAEAEQLFARAVQIGNTRLGDRYVFAGHQVDRPPFDLQGNYFGDVGVMEIELGNGQRLGLNTPGTVPFFGISEITPDMQKLREDETRRDEPTLKGDLRSPASVIADKDGVNPIEEPDKYRLISERTGVNVFEVMRNFQKGLELGDKKPINDTLDGLDAALKQVLAARASVGARQNMLDMGARTVESQNVTSQEILSGVQDADSLKTFSDLAKNENVLKIAMETNARLIAPSLLDFLK